MGDLLASPPATVWEALRLTPLHELHDGFQSKVFVVENTAGRLVAKLVEEQHADSHHEGRVRLVCDLAKLNTAVVGPVSFGTETIRTVDGWHVVCYPYVDGKHPDTNSSADVEAMATTLGSLHESMALLDAEALPLVAALRATGQKAHVDQQLIHGDYSASNLVATPSGLRVIDFDECGRGDVAFELGNTLYMVLFDAWRAGQMPRYRQFQNRFVDGYRRATSVEFEASELVDHIRARGAALERWLATPAEAPVGIRTASPEWRAELRKFVDEVDSLNLGHRTWCE